MPIPIPIVDLIAMLDYGTISDLELAQDGITVQASSLIAPTPYWRGQLLKLGQK